MNVVVLVHLWFFFCCIRTILKLNKVSLSQKTDWMNVSCFKMSSQFNHIVVLPWSEYSASKLRLKNLTSLGLCSTIFQAVAYDISRYSSEKLTEGICNKSITIWSDSQSALKAFGSYRIHSTIVLNCRGLLDRFTNNVVKLVWVPEHYDIQGNEIADTLA